MPGQRSKFRFQISNPQRAFETVCCDLLPYKKYIYRRWLHTCTDWLRAASSLADADDDDDDADDDDDEPGTVW